jgi:outer membrane protein assembly factor BamE
MHLQMNARFRIFPLSAVAALLLTILTACSSVKLPGVYRLDIQQGNVISEEMLDQLELGMDRRKVRFILGTPLLTDPFNENRWDYLYSLKKGGGDRVQRNISLLFENDRLVRIEGDIQSGTIAEGTAPRTDTVVTVPAERRKEGFFAGLIPDFLKTDSGKHIVPAEAPESATTVATVSGSDGGATGEEGQPETISEEDRADLEALFGDFGRLGGNADEPAEVTGPAPRQEAESR